MIGDFSGTFCGIAFGPGTPYKTAALTGWFDYVSQPLGGATSGSSSTLPAPKPYDNGAWPAPYWVPVRDYTLALEIVPDGEVSFVDAAAALRAATSPDGNDKALSVQVDGLATTAHGKITNRAIPTDLAYQVGFAVATFTIEASDPRRLGEPIVASTGLPASSGGLTFPATFPIEFDATQTTGDINITNPGDYTGLLTARIDGPCVGPILTNTASDSTLAFSPSLSIAAGDWLDIDMAAMSALYNGQSSRASSIISRSWFGFMPGVNHIGFTAADYSPSALLTVTATPAWV